MTVDRVALERTRRSPDPVLGEERDVDGGGVAVGLVRISCSVLLLAVQPSAKYHVGDVWVTQDVTTSPAFRCRGPLLDHALAALDLDEGGDEGPADRSLDIEGQLAARRGDERLDDGGNSGVGADVRDMTARRSPDVGRVGDDDLPANGVVGGRHAGAVPGGAADGRRTSELSRRHQGHRRRRWRCQRRQPHDRRRPEGRRVHRRQHRRAGAADERRRRQARHRSRPHARPRRRQRSRRRAQRRRVAPRRDRRGDQGRRHGVHHRRRGRRHRHRRGAGHRRDRRAASARWPSASSPVRSASRAGAVRCRPTPACSG